MRPFGNSTPVEGPPADARTEAVVRRHLNAHFHKPIQAHNLEAFHRLADHIRPEDRIVLDAGCGTGQSTLRLAHRHPDAWRIGVDKSAHRLARGVGLDPVAGIKSRGRTVWLRSDLVDFWRLAFSAGWRFAHQYLLYPNPWPKPGHLQRRWHGHPVFPTIVSVGAVITLRSNWSTYVEEFGRALTVVGVSAQVGSPEGEDLSPFEAKYRASGHSLFELRTTVDGPVRSADFAK